MPPSLLDAILDGPFALTPRPEPVPGDLRRGWGIALVVLMLGNSRGKRASLQKLHFLAHSIRTRQTRFQVQQIFAHTLRSSDLLIRFEPWLSRALSFATGAGLIDLQGGRSAKLKEPGLQFLDVLYHDETLFTEEKQFLDAVGALATERTVEKIMRLELLL